MVRRTRSSITPRERAATAAGARPPSPLSAEGGPPRGASAGGTDMLRSSSGAAAGAGAARPLYEALEDLLLTED